MNIVRHRILIDPTYGSQTLLLTAVCTTCGTRSQIESEYIDIWRWGLDERVESSLARVLKKQSSQGLYVCDYCGGVSVPSPRTVRGLVGELKTLLGHLPSGIGPEWALTELDKELLAHLSEKSMIGGVHCYQPGGIHYSSANHFYLRHCPCEKCNKARFGKPPTSSNVFDLDRIRALMPEPELVTS